MRGARAFSCAALRLGAVAVQAARASTDTGLQRAKAQGVPNRRFTLLEAAPAIAVAAARVRIWLAISATAHLLSGAVHTVAAATQTACRRRYR